MKDDLDRRDFIKLASLGTVGRRAFVGAIGTLGIGGVTEAAPAQESVAFERITPQPPVLKASDFRLAAAETLPQTESYQQAVFSGSVSGIPKDEGLDRITAPPFTAVLRQSFALFDRSTG